MTWCEENDVDYGFGLPGTKPLSKKVDETADAVRTERAVGDKDIVRGYAETRHKAGSWHKERRAVARIEATRLGLDVRFVVTNLDGSADWLYETLYCARGRRKISSSCTRLSLPPIARRAARRWPTRSASFCTLPTGSCSRPRRHSERARPGQGRVRNIAPQAAQDRRSRGRNGEPRPSGLRRRLSRGRALRRSARRADAARTLNDGAPRPLSPCRFLQRVQQCRS